MHSAAAVVTGLTLAVSVLIGILPNAEAKTVRWGADRDIVSLDPYSYGDTFTLAFLNHVYEGLVRYNEQLKIEPALATGWEIVDPATWRFKLRRGVKFHNGALLTADDVIASLERVSHEASPLKGNLPAYKSARKVDDHTVDIVLNGPYPLLLNDLTNVHIFNKAWLVANNSLVPTDAGKKIEGFATHNTMGTGPFKLESRQPDAKTVLVVHPDWWDKPKHNVTRVEFTPIKSAATRVAALIAGEVNFTNLAPIQDLPRLAATPEVKVLETADLRTIMLGFNFRDELNDSDLKGKNPFKDLRVRTALYQAINIDQIQQRVMRGKSRNAGALVAPAIPGYQPALDDRLPYDADAAKKLLAEAGYPGGFSFGFNCMSEGGYVNEEELCQAVASMWSRIGLKPKLDIAPRSMQVPKRTAGKTDVFTFGWATEPMIDTYSLLVQVLRSKSGTAGVFNWGGWTFTRIDQLTDQAARELTTPKRLALMSEALKVAKDEVVFIPLHQQPIAWAIRSTEVESVVQLPDNKVRLWHTRMK